MHARVRAARASRGTALITIPTGELLTAWLACPANKKISGVTLCALGLTSIIHAQGTGIGHVAAWYIDIFIERFEGDGVRRPLGSFIVPDSNISGDIFC